MVASIFVNPTQFGPNEDPRAIPRLRTRLRDDRDGSGRYGFRAGSRADFICRAQQTVGRGDGVDARAMRQWRPGHFRGVTTVVAKLFNIVKPHLALFGEKDFQQLRAIERMVADLNFDIEILPMPIVRERRPPRDVARATPTSRPSSIAMRSR